MDWRYFFTIPSFLVGLLVGFQFIHQRYDQEPLRAAVTLPGILYLFTRGAVPAGVYVLLYSLHLMPQPLWFWSLVCGTAGTELILRSKIFIKEDRSQDGTTRELMYGPLDLLQWYQNLFLDGIRKRLPTDKAEIYLAILKRTVPEGMKFEDMCVKVRDNLHFFQRRRTLFHAALAYLYKANKQTHELIDQAVEECLTEYHHEVLTRGDNPDVNKKFKYKLGYIIIDLPRVGERGLKLLLS